VEDTAAETRLFPTATELLVMSDIERETWMQRSLDLAVNEEFETFDAFGEENF